MNRRFLPWLLAGLWGLLGFGLLTLAFLPYLPLKNFLGRLILDNNFNSLKPGNTSVFHGLFFAAALLCFALAALSAVRKWQVIGVSGLSLWRDARSFFAALRPPKNETGFLAALLIVTVLGVVLRLEHILQPMKHDEAYTYVAFGRSFFAAISDYHLPNNHVFHSILVNLSTRLFGVAPWAVRLPALTAGVLTIPAIYCLGRRLYDRWTGLGAALFVAWFPPFIAYANNARGYTLVALFTVVILILGDRVRRNKNTFAWVLISFFSALGLYTVPVFLFPFGILFVWLFIENWLGDVNFIPPSYRSKGHFLQHWLVAGLLAAVLTLLFYLPIFVYTSPQQLFGNAFVAPLPWGDLFITLAHRFSETWTEWTGRVPLLFQLVAVIGFILAFLFRNRISKIRFPVQLAAVSWIFCLLILQRPNAWSKVWVFLQPLLLLWAAAGFFGLLNSLRWKVFNRLPLASVIFGAALAAGWLQGARLIPQLPDLWAIQGPEEKSILYIQSRWQPGDIIVVAPTLDAPIWYYSELHALDHVYLQSNTASFQRVFILVNLPEAQTISSVVADRGPASGTLALDSARLLNRFAGVEIFLALRK